MSVDAGSPLGREWAREEIDKLNRLDLAELEEKRVLSECPFPKGRKAGISCEKVIVALREDGKYMRICPEPTGACIYHGGSDS